MFKNPKVIGSASLILSALIYSFFGLLSRTIGFSLPLFYQIWTRDLLQALILGVVILLFHTPKKMAKKDLPWIIFRSINGTLAFVAIYIAFNFIPIGTGYFIFYAGSTLGGYAIGKILFKEDLTLIKITSLVLSLAGLLFIFNLNFQNTKFVFALLALLSGFATSIWNTVSKKVSDKYSATLLNFYDALFATLTTLPISFFLQEIWVKPSLTPPWIASLLFVAMFMANGQLMIYGFKYLEANIGSLIMLIEVLFGIVIGFIFYQETISLPTLLGGVLIIFAIIFSELSSKIPSSTLQVE